MRSLSDALRIWNRLNSPAASKVDGGSSHRRALTTEPERGLVPIVGPNGMFYANTVGAFASVSTGGNWGRFSFAAHRWDLKLVDGNEFFLLFPDDALELAGSEIFDVPFLVVIFA